MSSNSTGSEPWELSDSGRILITVIFGAVIFVGIVGNVLVIALVLLVKKMRSAVNLCLASLALADLFVLIFLPTIPFISLYRLTYSTLGTNFCVFIQSIDRGAIVCSTLIFLLIGIERYTVLCHPLKTLGMWTMRKVCVVLGVIWMVAVGVSMPYGYLARYGTIGNSTTVYCYLLWNTPWIKWYETAVYTGAFFLPIPVMTVLYGKMIITLRTEIPESDAQGAGAREARKSRSQVVRMLVSVIIIFVVCHLPFKIYVLLYLFDRDVITDMDAETNFIVNWVSRVILYVNHAANPVIYFCMSVNFRNAFKRLFCESCKKSGLQLEKSTVSHTVSSGI